MQLNCWLARTKLCMICKIYLLYPMFGKRHLDDKIFRDTDETSGVIKSSLHMPSDQASSVNLFAIQGKTLYQIKNEG